MTKYFLLITFLFHSSNSQGQGKVDLIGRWEPLFVSSIDFYYNFKTDSFFFSKPLESKYSDSSIRKKVLSNFKNLYGAFHLLFEINNVYREQHDTLIVVKGKYEVIPSKKTVMLYVENPNPDEKDIKLDYYYKDGVLLISYKEKGEGAEYVLQRQQK